MSNPLETESYAYTLRSCLDAYPKGSQLQDSKKDMLSVAEANLSVIFFRYNGEDEQETYLGLDQQKLEQIVKLPVEYLVAYFSEEPDTETDEINFGNLIPESDIRHMLTIGCLKEIATCQAYSEALELTGEVPTQHELSLVINSPSLSISSFNRNDGNSKGQLSLSKNLELDLTKYKHRVEQLRQMVQKIHSKAKQNKNIESHSMR